MSRFLTLPIYEPQMKRASMDARMIYSPKWNGGDGSVVNVTINLDQIAAIEPAEGGCFIFLTTGFEYYCTLEMGQLTSAINQAWIPNGPVSK